MDYPTFKELIERSDITVSKLDIPYSILDGRCWTAIVNPSSDNIIVNYVVNRYEIKDQCFDVFSSKHNLIDVSIDSIVNTIESLRSI